MIMRFAAGAALLAVFCVSGTANAATVTFDGLPGSNSDPFSSYSEAGFNVVNSGGQFLVAKNFGNPTPDLYTTSVGQVTFSRVGGGSFGFSSFDIAANNGDATYSIQGFLGGSQVYQYAGVEAGRSLNFGFDTIANSFEGTSIDALSITYRVAGTSANLDNISFAVSSVPLPASAPMFGAALLGLAGLGYAAKRKKAAAAA